MAEIKTNYWVASLAIFITALITATATYQLVPTGSYKVCDNGIGWQFNSDTGQYSCGDRKYDCASVRSTKTGKSNYYCDEATRVEVKTETQTIAQDCPACSDSEQCTDFISYTDTGKTFCRRYTDGTQKCTQEYKYK